MNIFSLFRNLYNNLFNKNQVNSTEVVNLVDTLIIPKRENLSEQYVKMLDTFKSEYVDKLRHRVLFSGDLDIDGVRQDMDMNIELLRDILSKEVGTSIFSVVNSETVDTMQVNYMVRASKMELYLNHILELEREVKLRILALDEILKEKVFFSPIKKNAIRNKLDNLRFLGHVFQNQVSASINEIKASIKEMETLQFTKDLDDCSEEVATKFRELLSMLTAVAPKKCEEGKISEFSSPYLNMAYIERELELYVYNNKEKVDSISDMILSPQTIESLKNIELMIRIFYEYGNGLIDRNTLDLFYRVKFIDVTRNINYVYDSSIFDNMSYIESECYENIVMEKINIWTSNRDGKFVRIISKVFRNENSEYDFLSILKNRTLLTLLLNLYNSSVGEFFRSYKLNIEEYSDVINFYEDVFTWEKELSFQTMYWLAKCEKVLNKIPLLDLYDYYVKLTKKSLNVVYDNFYNLPNGLVSIDFKGREDIQGNLILDMIRKESKNKYVQMPTSLRKVNGRFLGDTKILGLRLNDGLEELGENSLNIAGLDSIEIPSSVRLIDLKNSCGNLKTVTFKDFENSSILDSDSELAKSFVNSFFTKEYIPSVNLNFKFYIITELNFIVFDSIHSKEFSLSKDDLFIRSYENWSFYNPSGGLEENVIEKIKKCILEYQSIEEKKSLTL